MSETDLFFHLKLGDLIRARHAIPFRNLFSFTWPDSPDPDLAWGFQVLVSLLHSAGGFPAIVLLKTLLVTLAAALVHRTARRAGAGPLSSAACIALAVLAAEQRIVERPHLFTFIGLGALGLLLVEAERRPRLLWLAVPLVWIWANLHAGVFLSIVVLALSFVGAHIDKTPIAKMFTQAAVLGLSVLSTFATPAGARLPKYLLWHTGLGATRIIEEFRRADPWDDPWFFVMLALSVLVILGQRSRVSIRRLLPIVAVAILASASVRFVAEWAFIAAPFIAIGLTPLELAITRHHRIVLASGSALCFSLVVMDRWHQPVEIGLASDVVPFDAIDFITKNGLRDRLYEDLDVGCYLLWEGWPRYRVFQDARLPAYPDEFHRALDRTPLEPAAFDALLRKYEVDAALINYPWINMRAGSFDPEAWALLYRDDEAMVFARRTAKFDPVIARYEIPIRVRFRFLGGSSFEPLRARPTRSPLSDAEWRDRLSRL